MTDRTDDSLPEWTEEELALLRSAERDRPSSRSLPAALAAVGAGSAIVTGTAAAAAGAGVAAASAKWGGIVAISKWVAVVALGGTVVAGGVVLSKRSAMKRPAVQAVHGPQTSPRPAAQPAVATPAAEATRGTTPPAEPAPARSTAAKRTPSQPDIRREIAALDAARTTLRAGHPQQALVTLDGYEAKFAKSGALRVEATALRIEALVRAGHRAQADALAAAFLSSHPRSPYAARIRALVGDPSSAPSR